MHDDVQNSCLKMFLPHGILRILWESENVFSLLIREVSQNSLLLYRRMYIGSPYGTLVDDMSFSNGMYFYTYDRPDQNQCAVRSTHEGRMVVQLLRLCFTERRVLPRGQIPPQWSLLWRNLLEGLGRLRLLNEICQHDRVSVAIISITRKCN